MKQLIIDIKQRLSTVQTLKYIDTDWGQLDKLNPPVGWPCALVDILDGEYTNEGSHTQIGVLTVQISVADVIASPSSNGASAGQKERALSVFDLIRDVNAALHGWHGSPHYGSLTKQKFKRRPRPDGVRQYLLTYKVRLTDSSAKPEPPTLKVRSVRITT